MPSCLMCRVKPQAHPFLTPLCTSIIQLLLLLLQPLLLPLSLLRALLLLWLSGVRLLELHTNCSLTFLPFSIFAQAVRLSVF